MAFKKVSSLDTPRKLGHSNQQPKRSEEIGNDGEGALQIHELGDRKKWHQQ